MEVVLLTDEELIEIERRARWLASNDGRKPRQEDGEAMLRLVSEVRALRDAREAPSSVNFAQPEA